MCEVHDEIRTIIVHIINNSFEKEVFPSDLNLFDPHGSILPKLPKVYEKIIFLQLLDFVNLQFTASASLISARVTLNKDTAKN